MSEDARNKQEALNWKRVERSVSNRLQHGVSEGQTRSSRQSRSLLTTMSRSLRLHAITNLNYRFSQSRYTFAEWEDGTMSESRVDTFVHIFVKTKALQIHDVIDCAIPRKQYCDFQSKSFLKSRNVFVGAGFVRDAITSSEMSGRDCHVFRKYCIKTPSPLLYIRFSTKE